MGGRNEPCVVAPDVMLAPEYVRRHILNNYRFFLWYLPEDLWMQVNE